jgi:hypothetical protein
MLPQYCWIYIHKQQVIHQDSDLVDLFDNIYKLYQHLISSEVKIYYVRTPDRVLKQCSSPKMVDLVSTLHACHIQIRQMCELTDKALDNHIFSKHVAEEPTIPL